MTEQNEQREHERPRLEWEVVVELKGEEFFVRVNRAKGRRIFSMEMGGVRRDGSTARFIPMTWEVTEGDVVVTAPRYPDKLEALIFAARNRVVDILSNEGVHYEKNRSRDGSGGGSGGGGGGSGGGGAGGERTTMRRGKTERDRERKRHRREANK